MERRLSNVFCVCLASVFGRSLRWVLADTEIDPRGCRGFYHARARARHCQVCLNGRALRILALPQMLFADEVFGAARIPIAGGKQRMLLIPMIGRSPNRRHLTRAHGVFVAWLHEQHRRESVEFTYKSSEGVVVDIFTKSIHAPTKWTESRTLIICRWQRG